jgi:hypothetical protein
MGNKNCVASATLQDADTAFTSLQNIALNDVQHTLVETLISYSLSNGDMCTTKEDIYSYKTQIVKSVLALNKQTCPKKLEIIGDDRTLVIPRWSFYVTNNDDNETILLNHKGANEFRQLLSQYESPFESEPISFTTIQSLLWENLARSHRSLRVVRRGDIDPESGVRKSGEHPFHCLLKKHHYREPTNSLLSVKVIEYYGHNLPMHQETPTAATYHPQPVKTLPAGSQSRNIKYPNPSI